MTPVLAECACCKGAGEHGHQRSTDPATFEPSTCITCSGRGEVHTNHGRRCDANQPPKGWIK